jgi:hypothetical protein
MTYKITSPHSIALAFGDLTVSPGANEIRGEVPRAVLQGMRDAGLRVEAVNDAPAPPAEPPTPELPPTGEPTTAESESESASAPDVETPPDLDTGSTPEG